MKTGRGYHKRGIFVNGNKSFYRCATHPKRGLEDINTSTCLLGACIAFAYFVGLNLESQLAGTFWKLEPECWCDGVIAP